MRLKTYVVLAAGVFTLACGPQAERLELAPRPVPMMVARGEKVTVEANAFDIKGNPIQQPAVAWSSSNNDVATVENGVVTAHRSGTTVITARASDKAQAMLDVTVAIPSSLEIVQGSALIVAKGHSSWISALLRNEKGVPIRDLTAEWSSEDPSIAVVENNRLKGVSPGRVAVNARYGHLSAKVNVRVLDAELVYLELLPTRLKLEQPMVTKELRARMLDSKGRSVSDIPLLWFTSNPAVATVDDSGRVTGLKPGTALISVTHGRFKAGSDVVVLEAPERKP